MKHKIRDNIIFIIDALGISALYRMYMRTKGPLVRVLCFHDVADKKWFSEVVDMLSKNYHVITPKQFHEQDFDPAKINIFLTFDDGYLSWIDNCLPILQKHNFKALFFVNSGLLDIADDSEKVAAYMKDRLLILPKLPLTWDGAKQLISMGHSIGGHTVSHKNLTKLTEFEVQNEIQIDKERIESKLNITLTDFAFPFGTKKHFSQMASTQAYNAGYTYLYSSRSSFVRNVFVSPISRLLVEKNQTMTKLRIWIKGSYDMVSVVYQFKYFK